MEAFRKAVEAMDAEALLATLSEDIVLHSPILFRPIVGKAAVGHVLRAVTRVLTSFTYVAELQGDGKAALQFRAKVGKFDLEGIDLGVVDANGKVADLTVFMRPLSATQAFRAAMEAALGFTTPAT